MLFNCLSYTHECMIEKGFLHRKNSKIEWFSHLNEVEIKDLS